MAFFMLSFVLSTPLFAADLSNGLIVHYTFDGDLSGSVTDVSGNGNDGTMYGSAYISDDAKSGKALHLPTDVTPANDYVHIENGITSDLENFTVATWVKLDNIKDWQRIFDFGENTSNNMFLTVKGGSGVRFAIKEDINKKEQQIQGTALSTGKWIHLAVSVDYSQSAGWLYVDGALVGTTRTMTYRPMDMIGSTQNFIGKAQYSDPGFNGLIDDFRVYNRSLSEDEILMLVGYPEELVTAYKSLVNSTIMGQNTDINGIWTDMTLPTTLGSVAVVWTSSKPEIISTIGKVTSPDDFDAAVKLTATLSFTKGDTPYTMQKTFTVTVSANELVPLVAGWDFRDDAVVLDGGSIKIKAFDIDGKLIEDKHLGTVMNAAKIRTIGKPQNGQYNVLDLGDSDGYFDMGTETGKSIYALSNFSVGGYFRVHENYTLLNNAGNYLFAFSNTDNAGRDQNGYLIGRFSGGCNVTCAEKYWGSGDTRAVGVSPTQGEWHHFFYTQEGKVGVLYLDTEEIARNENMNIPSATIALNDREGTLHNYIGKAIGQASDINLRQTLVYDFRLYALALTADDIQTPGTLGNISATIADLNAAYNDASDYIPTDLEDALRNFNLTGDLDNITADFTLPNAASPIQTVWTSSLDDVIHIEGNTAKVTRPKLYNTPVTLTVTLTKGVHQLSKTFDVKVLETGRAFTSDLVVRYDFSQVDGRTVTDVAEMNFKGKLMNEASIVKLTTADNETINALSLGNGTGYFDLGYEIGQVFYNTSDYTLSAYFKIDENYTGLTSAGNFLWTISNPGTANGYLIAILKDSRVEARGVTNETLKAIDENGLEGQPAKKGEWVHFAYTQEGEIGTIYINGVYSNQSIMSNIPSVILPYEGLAGTPNNWIGRSNYATDTYLHNTLVTDFRMYNRALYADDFQTPEFDVAATLEKLNGSTGIKGNKLSASPYNVTGKNGQIEIVGLDGSENVYVYDLLGRQYKLNGENTLSVKTGIYIVKINSFVTKVLVK